ncbi:MAG: amidohydrolase family protein [Nitrospirota bacterium]
MNLDPNTIPPGAVDVHVHLRDPAGLADAATAGIAALRDGGTKKGSGLLAVSPGVQVISAGRALARKGGYGAFFGKAVEHREEIKAEIGKLKSAGAGIIKVVASGMVSLKEPGGITPGGFGPDDLRFIVEEASKLGLSVMAHANGETAIRNAAEAGVRSIEHGFFMTEEALAAMKAHTVWWVPTVGALLRAAEVHPLSAGMRSFIEMTIKGHLVMLRQAYELGVPLAVGTDCTLPDPHYRGAYEAELAYFRDAGIPEDDVRRIASEGGRALLGLV